MKKVNQYFDERGNKLPSVTQILQVIAKPQLMYWYGKMGNEKAKQILDEAGEFGGKVHTLIEQSIKGQKVTLSGRFVDIIENFKITTGGWEWVEFEKVLINQKDGWGGTADAIAKIGGVKTLVDFKTSGGIYLEHYLQLSAYMQQLPNDINHACILHLDKETNGWEVLEAETQGLYEVFLAAKVIYDYKKGGK